MAKREYLRLPVGRLVGGNVYSGFDTDYEKRPYGVRDDGSKILKWSVVLAIPYSDPECGRVKAMLRRIAETGFPQLPIEEAKAAARGLTFKFSWKTADGNDPKFEGKTGYANHFIMYLSTKLRAPGVCYLGAGGVPVTSTSSESCPIKAGDYIQPFIDISVNSASNPDGSLPTNAGLYLTPRNVLFVKEGDSIDVGLPPLAEMYGDTYVAMDVADPSAQIQYQQPPQAQAQYQQPPQAQAQYQQPQQAQDEPAELPRTERHSVLDVNDKS